MDEAELQDQMAQLVERIDQLEQRIETLERGGSQRVTTPTAVTNTVPASTVNNEAVIEAIVAALKQIGEGDAGAVRQQMIKNGQPNTITRSDVNKALYNRKDLFEITRQEGMKPVWKLLG